MKKLSIGHCQVDIIHECAREYSLEPLMTDGLDACLIGSVNLKNDEAKSYEIMLDKDPSIQNQCFKLLTTHTESQEYAKYIPQTTSSNSQIQVFR